MTCNCSLTNSILGDGCSVCNPKLWAEVLADQNCQRDGCDIMGAIHVSRAKWLCPRCGADVSLSVVMLNDARQIKNP